MTGHLDKAASPSSSRKQRLKEFFVVSADCHVNEPNDVYSARIEPKFKDRLPRIEVDEKGRKWFVAEGIRPSRIREAPRDEAIDVGEFKQQAEREGARPHLDKTKGAMFQRQGGFGPERYEDMDYDGVDAEIVFPNKGLVNWQSPDPEHNVAMCRAWTDWAHETFSDSARSFPCACIAPADIPAAVKEVERVAALGFRAVMMPPLVRNGLGYNMPEYDPLWAALTETGLPLCFHAGTGKDPRTAMGNGGAILNFVVHAMNTVVEPVVQLCASGVFDRFPKLQFATIEAGAGWIPYTLWAMDHGARCHAFWVSPKLQDLPSGYFRRHGHASFESEPIGVELRRYLGPESLLWGNDYPHIEGSWPHSAEAIEKWSAGLGSDEVARIVGLNAAKLFNIPVPEAVGA
ncbi:amidohydrolase family protein [Sinimarinibacterium flocculans]|uniref:amidohydrolase family protein n=1 Tax=Sinimarinibacterium flocculans TaxID=985250 RepID=UPI00248F5347|nr:amidohydrolase family protein [Sinimarinibacterium flocculans]